MIGRLHHVGISTPDIERAIAFYSSLFGFEVMQRGGWEPGNTARDRQHLAEGTSAVSALLERDGMLLELRQYRHPQGAPQPVDRPVVDHGINHFCIHVEDIDGEYERLQAAGMAFHCEPLEVAPGLRLTYGRDPDGNVIELLEGDIEALRQPAR
ncbi:MAG: VOC family protein [Dehalococcoidia bacterium]